MRMSREELARLSIKTEPLKVNRVTTVSNTSTTTAYPVERADNVQPPPQTRPPQIARPRPPVVPQDQRGVSPMRQTLEQQLRNRPATPARPSRPPVIPAGTGGGRGPGSDPQEGVGSGSVAPGGVKMR